MLIRSKLASIAAVEFDRLVHGLERHPRAGEARHRPAVKPVIQHFLHAGRIEDRDHHIDEVVFGLVRGGGRFRGVVVAHQRQHAAVLRGAGQIGMAEHVAGAVDARALAVPHGEHAIELAFAAQFGLLRAPDRGRRQILVDAGLEADVALLQERRGALELRIETAERRAAIAADIARRIQAVAAVQLLLHEAKPHQRLEAGDEHVGMAEIVFVFELDVAQRHRGAAFHTLRCLVTPVCPCGPDSARGQRPLTYSPAGGANNAAAAAANSPSRTRFAVRQNRRPRVRQDV